MGRTRRLGVVGTLIWDRIWLFGATAPVETWGGIAYSLAAAAAARPADWQIVPLLKIGADLYSEACELLAEVPGMDLGSLQRVPEPNNRVELRYVDGAHRGERLVGGVPPWTGEELLAAVESLDALYVNFITGHEMPLKAAEALRRGFQGPIYTDLHSLLLGHAADGHRFERPLPDWNRWVRCFDLVQINEEELATQAHSAGGEPWQFAATSIGPPPQTLLVSRGAAGAWYVSSDGHSRAIPLPAGPQAGDPTGCGDVWGGTLFPVLLGGSDLEGSIVRAHRAAARKMSHSGAPGLYAHLAADTFSA